MMAKLSLTTSIRKVLNFICIKKRESTRVIVDFAGIIDDVWLEIFLHLPLKSICKFRCVSKLWFSLLSDPSFMHIVFHKPTIIRSLPWTIFHECWYNQFDGFFREDPRHQLFRFTCPETHYKYIDFHDGFSFRFMLDMKQFRFKFARLLLLDSSNGLVLCSDQWSNEFGLNRTYNHWYYICNPMTKQFIFFSRPQGPQLLAETSPSVIECISSTSFNSTTSTYKVVVIPWFEKPTTKFNLQVFSSNTAKWNTYKVVCNQGVTTSKDTITHNGYLFWIDRVSQTANVLVAYNLHDSNNSSGAECKLIDLPKEPNCSDWYNTLGESEGFLVYGVHNREDQTISSWVLDDGGWVWQSVHMNIGIKNVSAPGSYYHGRRPSVFFCPVNLDVVMFKDSQSVLQGYYNLVTGYGKLLVPNPRLCGNTECGACYITYKLYKDPRELFFIPRPTVIPPLATPIEQEYHPFLSKRYVERLLKGEPGAKGTAPVPPCAKPAPRS